MKEYTGRPREVDALTYKDAFRHAAKHDLMTSEAVERWCACRDNRNNTAHDYGVGFAGETLELLLGFIGDARAVEAVLRDAFSESNLPILVDIQDWSRIPDSFREEIERSGVVVFPL